MKLKYILLAICLSLFGQAFAANVHLHPNAGDTNKKSAPQSTMYPGPCQIEIINDSYTDVFVYGTFDDNTQINFPIYAREYPHYIDLYYYNYCHAEMYLRIESRQFPYPLIYAGYTSVNSTVRIVPYLNKSVKAEILQK